MTQSPEVSKTARFSWHRDDLESKLGMKGARFTGVKGGVWFIAAGLITAGFYGVLCLFPDHAVAKLFTERGVFQYVSVLFAVWALVIVLVKRGKIRVQAKALEFRDLVPTEADFVLSPGTVGQVLGPMRAACDDTSCFILFNRVDLALANLKNIGQVADLDNVLDSLACNDEDVMVSSYTLLKGLIWAIPVLGFIGTVQGLSMAIGNFGGALAANAEIKELIPVLQGVTKGLSTAFDTTFVALVAALAIQLLLVGVRKSEEEMMSMVRSYCQKHLIGRLRLTAM